MKELLLLRHAKSSWKQVDVADHDRPLNRRGTRDAPRMGRLLVQEKLVPERIIHSTARRARDTAVALAEACGFEGELVSRAELYASTPQRHLEVLRDLPEELSRVLVVAHNPELEGLLALLTGCRESLPTAALAHIALPIDRWEDLRRPPSAELIGLWRPRELETQERNG